MTGHVSKKPTFPWVLLKKWLLGVPGEKLGGGKREDESTILEGLRVPSYGALFFYLKKNYRFVIEENI